MCDKKVGVEKDRTMRWREYVRGCRRNQKDEKKRYTSIEKQKNATEQKNVIRCKIRGKNVFRV